MIKYIQFKIKGKEFMGKVRALAAMIIIASIFSGCTTLKGVFSNDSGRIAQEFFNDLQKSDRQAAYNLLAKGLSQKISFNQFDELMVSMEGQWGRIVDTETALMPFHNRLGERNFIPLGVPEEKIRRYTFDVKFDNAELNCDLTLVPQEDQYKIVWISFWGSNTYLTPAIREKLDKLFSKSPDK
jgi:hypothetical protein